MENCMIYWNNFLSGIPSVVVALLILLLAFLVSWIVKKLIIKLMDLIKIENLFTKAGLKDDESKKAKDFVAKLAYLISFVLFLPGIFSTIGLNGVSEPIMSMMDKVMTYLPNIVAAIVILVVGLFVAKLVKEILIPIFGKMKLDEGLKKIGYEQKEGAKSVAEVFATIIYVLILIPIIIASLNALNISSISDPAISMLNQIFYFVPKLAGAIVIFYVGKFIAKLAFTLLDNVLESVGVDKFLDKLFKLTGTKGNEDFSLAKIIAYIVKYVIIVFFVVEALNVLKLDLLTNIGSAIISYMPYVLSTVLIFGAAVLLANFVEKVIISKFPTSKATAFISKVAIITIGVFVSLYQLGIAMEMVNAAFIIVLGALAVAFAISFGVGGREFASHMLSKLEKKIETDSKK